MRLKLLGLIVLTLIACSGGQTIKIRFDKLANIATGNSVYKGRQIVGFIKDIEVKNDNELLVTVRLNNGVKIPVDSKFILSIYEGQGSISIDVSDNSNSIDKDLIYNGLVNEVTLDQLGGRRLSIEEYHSLVKADTTFRQADSIIRVFRDLTKVLRDTSIK